MGLTGGRRGRQCLPAQAHAPGRPQLLHTHGRSGHEASGQGERSGAASPPPAATTADAFSAAAGSPTAADAAHEHAAASAAESPAPGPDAERRHREVQLAAIEFPAAAATPEEAATAAPNPRWAEAADDAAAAAQL